MGVGIRCIKVISADQGYILRAIKKKGGGGGGFKIFEQLKCHYLISGP